METQNRTYTGKVVNGTGDEAIVQITAEDFTAALRDAWNAGFTSGKVFTINRVKSGADAESYDLSEDEDAEFHREMDADTSQVFKEFTEQ